MLFQLTILGETLTQSESISLLIIVFGLIHLWNAFKEDEMYERTRNRNR